MSTSQTSGTNTPATLRRRAGWLFLGVLLITGAGLLFWTKAALPATQPAAALTTDQQAAAPIPVLAYYYIWFDQRSWERGKTDLPLLNAYTSDDRTVMQQHIRWAKQSGISGFIVNWKSTPTLNRRLAQLIELATQEQFELSIIYQGLDPDRMPLPVDEIAADLDYFIANYAAAPTFGMFGRPLVIWSGTWKYSPDQVAQITSTRRKQLLILASGRSLGEYQRLAGLVDGDAYYWPSANPETFPGYQEKLRSMGQAVHASGGLWIAPAAPGFDARLAGGTQVVERNDGEMLRVQMNGALGSSPDAVGLISWNEFTENSYVEPSNAYGMRYLEVLTDLHRAYIPQPGDTDSSSLADIQAQPESLLTLGGLGLLIVLSMSAIIWRSARADLRRYNDRAVIDESSR
jgi:Glycosyl hydrolase family 71